MDHGPTQEVLRSLCVKAQCWGVFKEGRKVHSRHQVVPVWREENGTSPSAPRSDEELGVAVAQESGRLLLQGRGTGPGAGCLHTMPGSLAYRKPRLYPGFHLVNFAEEDALSTWLMD